MDWSSLIRDDNLVLLLCLLFFLLLGGLDELVVDLHLDVTLLFLSSIILVTIMVTYRGSGVARRQFHQPSSSCYALCLTLIYKLKYFCIQALSVCSRDSIVGTYREPQT